MDKKILDVDIIMPCYNVSNLVQEAFYSILSGSCLPSKVILINDCSTDNTLEILKTLQEEYSFVEIINNISNMGAFKSREYAINISTSKFICIVDADDFLDSQSLELAYEDIIKYNAQASIFEINVSSFDKNVITKMFKNDVVSKVFTGRDACLLTLNGWKIGGFGIFDRKLYIESYLNISINVMNSDELLLREVLLNATVVVQSSGKYFYRINNESITRKINPKHLGLLESNLYLLNFVINNNLASYQIRKNLVRGGIKEMYKIVKYKDIFLESIQKEEFFSILSKFGIKEYLNKLSFMEWVFNIRYFIKAILIWLKIEVLKF